MLKLYNTLTRKKEIFKPIEKNNVGIYSCGPTVYSYQHIGNLRSYLFSDILKRVLLYNHYKVKHVMNITDVGHLTSDADVGEDKIEKAAIKEGKKASEITNYYLNIFQEDLKKLNIIKPNIECKATEHIKDQINLIKILEKKGFTYKTNDGIYFNTAKFKNYGKLAKLKKEGLKAGKRVSLGDKKNKTDFALWKLASKNEKRQQEWDSPWGIGFPGWHIECSAMASKYLGEHFDIHTGGEDHIPLHHSNEIAQSESAFKISPWVNYWMHGYFLLFNKEKISKSKGGLYTISQLQKKGFDPLDFRYFLLTANYRKQLNFTIKNLTNARNSRIRLKNIILSFNTDEKPKFNNKKYLKDFENAINNDLDTSLALQILWKLIRDKKANGKISTIKEMDKVFGLNLLEQEKIKIPDLLKKLLQQREKERKDKNYENADLLRLKIKNLGFLISDTNEGPKISN